MSGENFPGSSSGVWLWRAGVLSTWTIPAPEKTISRVIPNERFKNQHAWRHLRWPVFCLTCVWLMTGFMPGLVEAQTGREQDATGQAPVSLTDLGRFNENVLQHHRQNWSHLTPKIQCLPIIRQSLAMYLQLLTPSTYHGARCQPFGRSVN